MKIKSVISILQIITSSFVRRYLSYIRYRMIGEMNFRGMASALIAEVTKEEQKLITGRIVLVPS